MNLFVNTFQKTKQHQTNKNSKKKNEKIPKAGSIHENIEINDQYLDEILDIKIK